MTNNDDTRQFSLGSLEAERQKGRTRNRADAPFRAVEPEFWQSARIVMPLPGKAAVNPRVGRSVLDWFRVQGKDHLSRMNAVLRSYMAAQKR